MNEAGKNLLTFGFVRDFGKENNIEIPYDIVYLFISWLSFCDQFDRTLTHRHITIKTKKTNDKYGECQQIQMSAQSSDPFRTAICEHVCKRGDKQTWIFQIGARRSKAPEYLVFGIIDNHTAISVNDIKDFSEISGGFGLFLKDMGTYFQQKYSCRVFEYGAQFEVNHNDIIEMELDLTKENGTLSFEFHGKLKRKRDRAEETKHYSNVFDYCVDVNKQWRAAVTIAGRNQFVSLLPFGP